MILPQTCQSPFHLVVLVLLPLRARILATTKDDEWELVPEVVDGAKVPTALDIHYQIRIDLLLCCCIASVLTILTTTSSTIIVSTNHTHSLSRFHALRFVTFSLLFLSQS